MESQRNSSVAIDIEKFYNFLQKGQNQHGTSSDQSSICEIQQHVRKIHKNLYDPIVVSIGPYHHGKETLQFMEKQKWSCLQYTLASNPKKTLDDYMKLISELFPLVRSYYAGEIGIKNNHFFRMLLLDACFILVVLNAIEQNLDDQNFISQKEDCENQTIPWEYYFLTNDLFLVENQIPFFLLKRLYELITNKESTNGFLTDKLCNYVEQMLCNCPKSIKESERPRNFHNLLHLLQLYLKPSQIYDSHCPSLDSLHCWYRAVEYQAAGIQFKKREFDETNPHSLLDVRYISNVLEIPYLQIDENTATIFRNLIVFEQTSPQFGNDVTAYIIFMSHIIRTEKDATLLVSKGIMRHQLQSDDEVAKIFRELTEGLDFEFSCDYYLKNICRDTEAYCQRYMRSWKGWLRFKISSIRRWV